MKRTDIEWTATVQPDGSTEPGLSSNPIQYRDASGKAVWACVKKSSGCANCYAEAIAMRFDRGAAFTRANMAGLTPFLSEEEVWHILTAQKIGGKPVAGSKCFLGDMTDVFGEWVPDALLDRLFAVMAMRRDVTFQVLTKRADRMAAYFNTPGRRRLIAEQVMPLSNLLASAAGTHTKRLKMGDFEAAFLAPGPLANIWLGTSVENQAAADARIPHLLRTPAAVRFLSCEPLLGPVRLSPYRDATGNVVVTQGIDCDWVIVGGESGANSRPMAVEWARSLVSQCNAAGVPVFVKQMGGHLVLRNEGPNEIGTWNPRVTPAVDAAGAHFRVAMKDAKGGDPDEWPADLRVREFPTVKAA